ncbi:calpain 5-like isoform X2 [Clinocottus analis]|uniref:calpain 5-like isoform X2 n=1 Tax=Clinocottus analis TaxID=304258 RepID=UPI0035C1A443
MPERVHHFQGQSFHELRRSCLRRGALFKDPLFPATAQSLFYKREPPPGLTWKRPREICKDPRLFVDGISTRDLHQGSLGNCWMVAAISCLSSEPSLWKKVIPHHVDQEWNPKHLDLYAGIFHFRFWRLGRWTDVVVDDRLPVSADGVLLFCRSATPREFWSALLEKAYAKSQQWQQMSRAEREKTGLIVRDVGEFWMDFEDFCHYFTDVVVCRLVERSLLWPRSHWMEVRRYGEWAQAPVAAGAPPTADVHGNHAPSPGKINTRPGVTEQRGNRKEARLGESQQKKGGEGGKYKRDKAVRKVKKKDEDDGGEPGGWEAQMDKRSRCGGCINHRDTFLHNPQFMFDVSGKEQEVLICLQQEDRRIRRKDGGGENLPIGFEVLKVEANRCSRVQCVVEQAASSVYMDSRSVTLRGALAPGRYVVLPTTFLPGVTGRFLLRLFCHARVRLRELREDLPSPSIFQCFLPQHTLVTTVHLRRASGLSSPKQTAPDVYAVVQCENDSIRSHVFEAEGNPEFNLRAVFYRRYPDTPISIELWSRGRLWDRVLGEARLQTAESDRSRSHVMDLRGGQSRSGCRGCVYVETSSSACLTDL